MRKISANYIFTGTGEVLKQGIIELDDFGKILNVRDTKGELKEEQGLEFYNGILVPGFVNAHCHLELSHMKNVLQCRKQGLPKFIDEIIKKRFTPEDLQEILYVADKEMYDEGIVAVGDISNNDDSFGIKGNSKLHYYTFVEAFTINNKESERAFNQAKLYASKLSNHNLIGNIVPHASYSVPDRLWELIKTTETEQKRVVSIHNMETESENKLFDSKSGELMTTLQKIGFDYTNFTIDYPDSVRYSLSKLNPGDNILLIHNTYCSEQDIQNAQNYSSNIFWVLCPNSNLYIENRLPDIDLFYKKGVPICLGTDSYSSNDRLSILSEMLTISENFPLIPFADILNWATLSGAKALMLDNKVGTIETGKTPGINLISNFDFENIRLKPESTVKKII